MAPEKVRKECSFFSAQDCSVGRLDPDIEAGGLLYLGTCLEGFNPSLKPDPSLITEGTQVLV